MQLPRQRWLAIIKGSRATAGANERCQFQPSRLQQQTESHAAVVMRGPTCLLFVIMAAGRADWNSSSFRIRTARALLVQVRLKDL